jgi:hypothetical protein
MITKGKKYVYIRSVFNNQHQCNVSGFGFFKESRHGQKKKKQKTELDHLCTRKE